MALKIDANVEKSAAGLGEFDQKRPELRCEMKEQWKRGTEQMTRIETHALEESENGNSRRK